MWPVTTLRLAAGNRFYCGQRGSLLVVYAGTLGVGGVWWLVDGWLLRDLVAAANRRSSSSDVAEGGHSKAMKHVELTELGPGRAAQAEHDEPATEAGDQETEQGWRSVLARAAERHSSRVHAPHETHASHHHHQQQQQQQLGHQAPDPAPHGCDGSRQPLGEAASATGVSRAAGSGKQVTANKASKRSLALVPASDDFSAAGAAVP